MICKKKKNNLFVYSFVLGVFRLVHVACGILVPQPGIEPVPLYSGSAES